MANQPPVRIKRMTLELEDGSTRTFGGRGTFSITETSTKQEQGPDTPLRYVSLHMDVTNG